MRRSFEGKRHQPAKSEEKRKRCDRKHRGFGFFCAFLLCAGLISGGAAVSGESGAQEAVNAEAPADDAVQPEAPAQPVEEAQQNTPAPEDTEGGGEAGQQQEETPDQQQEELYPEDDGNGEESVPSVSRPDAGSAESSAAPVGTTAEPLTVSVTTAMKYAFAGENVLTFETQITGGTEPFETSCEIDRDGTPVWSSQEYQPEVTYMPEEAGGYELVLSVTDAAGQAASGRCAIPVAVRHEESPSDWEPALKEVRMTGRYAEDLLAIARTQLGYTESADNFIVTEEGARQGYTRYGQWQGDAYEPWDAAFAAFCLYYAGVRDVPADTKAEKWADELKRRGMYRDLTAENRPEEGDFLFTRDGEVTRIGLVEKTDDTGVTAIEGDVGGAVARVTYGWDDARLAGFGDPRTTLTDEAAGVTVTGIFPEGATLTVQLLAEDADGFTEAQDRIHAALSPLYDRYAVNLADVTETAVYVPSLTVNGEAVSPCKKVRVGVSACGGRFAGHGDVRVLTFSDEQTELLSAEEKDGGDGADAIVSASFRTDRLSEFALTAVAPDRLTMRRTAADGDAKVTVTYGAGAGVPESAELRVRQIRGDGDDADRAEYQKRQAEAAALLETEAGGENAASQPDTAASGSPGNAENADVSRQTDQNAENAAADQQADQNAENVAADQTEDSKEYAAYMEEVEAALASGRKVQMAKLFDITILDKEGNEVEPLTPVRANIEFVPKEVQEGTDLELYQFQTEGEKPQVMENVEVLTDDDNIVNGIEFETDGFSVYGIVGTEIQKEITLTTPDGENVTYVVSVTYGPDAQIPDGSTLEVVEVEPDSVAYKEVRNLLFSAVDTELTDDSEPKLEMVDDSGEVPLYSYTTPTSIVREIASDRCLDVLDISIKDADGNEVEPKAAVQVSIRMKKAPEGIDAQTVADTAVVQHLDESSGELVIETVASADESVDGTVLVANEGVEASFEVESFSTYTFTYGSGTNRRSVNVHYVDESGNELAAPNPEPAQNNGHSHLVYDIEGYDFVKTTINSASGTQISPYIQYRNFGQWHNSWGIWYQDEDYHWGYRTLTVSGDTRSLGNWTALNNNQDVYVVYRKKTTPPQGGESVPVVPQGEWPEFPSGDNTKPTKTSVENGDGTNTLSLTVTGAETPLTSGKVKAQVIVVFDLSGSMNYRMGSDTDPGNGEHSRLYYSKEAVESLTNALGTNDKLDVEMALVTFSNYARTAMGFTNVSSATGRQSFISTVDGLSATGGTNWEAALREANYIQTKSDAKTYVIFVSDGAPTFRISRGSITESNIAGNVDDGDAYYMSYGIYGSGGATHDEDRSFALAQATSIVNSNKTFYTVALTDANDTTHASEYMGDLNSRAGGAGNYSATSPEELANVINAIGTSITTELGFADIEIHDGITDLTNLNAKVLQSVDENSFKYYRYGGENNKYGTESNPSAWGNDPADSSKLEGGANKATYDSSTGAVEWKMGSDFQLEDGVTYKVSFKVWPDQDAYDWIAKLRNGTVQYANLPADVKPQIDEATLSLKTNTDAYVRYKKSSTTSGDTTTTGDPIQVDYNTVDPMPLPAQSIPIEKIFINELDPERYENEPVRISLTGDGDTFAVVNLNDSNNFKTSAFISYGLMTPGDEPVLKEPGHDFVLTELSAYHWDLEAGVYRPMIIGGERKLLQKVDSGGDYTIDGKQYKELADGASISATNYRRSNLNLTKNIVDKDGQTSINDKYPNQLFEYNITVNSSDGEDVWFSVQTDPDDYTTVVTDLTTSAHPEVDDEGNPKNNGYFYQHSGESFTVSLKPTWNLRFTNLPKGTTYTIVESSSEGFEFNRASLNPAGDDEQFTVTESTATVTGVVAEYNKQYQITYTNRSTMLDIVVIKTDDAGTSIPGATFNLLKKDGSSYHAIPNRDDLANFSIPVNGITLTGLLPGDYELEEVTPPDGYIIIKKETYFNLSDSDEVIKLSDESKDIASTSGEKKDTVSIKNQPGQALPNTGGPGTIPYTLGGIALIMASALMYGFRMRRRERRLN